MQNIFVMQFLYICRFIFSLSYQSDRCDSDSDKLYKYCDRLGKISSYIVSNFCLIICIFYYVYTKNLVIYSWLWISVDNNLFYILRKIFPELNYRCNWFAVLFEPIFFKIVMLRECYFSYIQVLFFLYILCYIKHIQDSDLYEICTKDFINVLKC